MGTGRALRTDIEGLRALAILMVVGFHLFPHSVPGGYLGVDVFLVLSGFLITGVLLDSDWSRPGRMLAGFWARRIRRLLPAATVVLLASTAAAAVLLEDWQKPPVAGQIGASALFVSNFWFLVEPWSVYVNPTLHFWSLSLEEQFYLFWPVVLVGIAVLGARRGPVGRPRTSTLALLATGVVILSLASALAADRPTYVYLMPQTRAWELAVGGLIAVTVRTPLRTRWTGPAGLVAVLVLAMSLVLVPEQRVWFALPVVAATAVLLVGAGPVDAVLALPVLQWVGRLSYSWYLWHWPVLAYVRFVEPGIGAVGLLVAAAVSLWAAWLSLRLVEQPLRTHPALVASPARCGLLGLACVGSVVVAVAAL